MIIDSGINNDKFFCFIIIIITIILNGLQNSSQKYCSSNFYSDPMGPSKEPRIKLDVGKF